MTIIGEPEPGKFKVVARVPTQTTARTMKIDPQTHRHYLAAATPVPAPPGPRRKAVEGAMSRLICDHRGGRLITASAMILPSSH